MGDHLLNELAPMMNNNLFILLIRKFYLYLFIYVSVFSIPFLYITYNAPLCIYVLNVYVFISTYVFKQVAHSLLLITLNTI